MERRPLHRPRFQKNHRSQSLPPCTTRKHLYIYGRHRPQRGPGGGKRRLKTMSKEERRRVAAKAARTSNSKIEKNLIAKALGEKGHGLGGNCGGSSLSASRRMVAIWSANSRILFSICSNGQSNPGNAPMPKQCYPGIQPKYCADRTKCSCLSCSGLSVGNAPRKHHRNSARILWFHKA